MVLIRLAILAVSALGCLTAQTTQGLISGSILNSVTGRPVSGASVTFNSATLSTSGTLQSDSAGYYFLPLLSTGTYSIRAIADGYQSQELQQLELPVAGRIPQLWGRSEPNLGFGPALAIPDLDDAVYDVFMSFRVGSEHKMLAPTTL